MQINTAEIDALRNASNPLILPQDLVVVFLDLPNEFVYDVIVRLSRLPIRLDKTIRFVDYDGTIYADRYRFRILDILQYYRGDSAYPIIREHFSHESDPSGLITFAKLLKPNEDLFGNLGDIFDPRNPDDVILTAGNRLYQYAKICLSGFANVPKIILEDAKYKPLAMLLYFLHIGYIPGNTQFYDDRIHNFAGADAVLRKILPELQSCRFF